MVMHSTQQLENNKKITYISTFINQIKADII